MFKLESYLTPWLLSYLDKYVKLKPEDFQLSLWGGDAVFNKLDLRLNVIENLTNIPIAFKSGVIHELRIHIPWTRITSEPVVVTINTLEFVAKLKDAPPNNTSTDKKQPTPDPSPSKQRENSPSPSPPEVRMIQQQQQQQQQLPAGYMQNIIAKILANVCVIVNNVIVKFVEDDIVLSINMKSAECFSVNPQWEKAFVEINASNIDLRKVLQLNDVTICLDRLDKSSSSSKTQSTRKVNFYQDPLVYRCSIQSRLDFKYSIASSASDSDSSQQLKLMKLDFYCTKLNVSITDQQLPMLMRLIELIQAIVSGTLNLRPGSGEDEANKEQESNASELYANIDALMKSAQVAAEQNAAAAAKAASGVDEKSNELQQQEQQQGWVSWAWSYVPSVSTIIGPTEEETESSANSNMRRLNKAESIQCLIGFYCDEFNLTFKLTRQSYSQQQPATPKDETDRPSSPSPTIKSYTFCPFVSCHLKGIANEVNVKNDETHIICGVSYIRVQSLNECCCKLCPAPSDNELVFFQAGQCDIEEKTFHYLSNSLFDANDEEQQQAALSSSDPLVNPESDTNKNRDRDGEEDTSLNGAKQQPSSRNKFGVVDENYGLMRFGAMFLDHFIRRDNLNNDAETHNKSVGVNSAFFIFYGIDINLSANLLHRVMKIWDCSQSHSYTEPYSSGKPITTTTATTSSDNHQTSSNPNESTTSIGSDIDLNSEVDIEKLAKSLEKHLPKSNLTLLLKDPTIKLHPYSHYLIAPIAASHQHSALDSSIVLTMKTLCFTRTCPLDENQLYEVVSKLAQPSSKLLYDCYIHSQINIDSVRMSLIMSARNNSIRHEAPILEPCYFEAHFKRVIMSPEKWCNQYFPLFESTFELPKIKLNLFKQQLFILNDYLDSYLYPSLDGSMFAQIKHPYVSKSRMKNAKIRQIVYKRLIEDYLAQSQFKKSEILRISINDLKAKISTTKILYLIQLDLNMLNVHMNKDNNSEEIISLFETSNKIRGKHSNIKDFLVLRAQMPLKIADDSTSTDSSVYFIPDPLFVYANLNEINIQLVKPLLDWLNYAPTKLATNDTMTSELLNLLVLDMLEDIPNTADVESSLKQQQQHGSARSNIETNTNIESVSSRSISVTAASKKKQSVASLNLRKQTSLTVVKSKNTSMSDDSSLVVIGHEYGHHKPSFIDAYFDLLKSIHIQICLKPINIGFKMPTSNKMLVINLPQLNVKTAATKCDLEEELMSSKLVELPFSYLRACERTTAKLPWIIELKSFHTFFYAEDYLHDYVDMSLFKPEHRETIVSPLDINMIFTLKPSYNQYDNLLSSLSFALSIDCAKPIEIQVRRSHSDLVIELVRNLYSTLSRFESRIDLEQFDHVIKMRAAEKNLANRAFETTFEDDTRSYSTLSIMREYELSSIDDELLDVKLGRAPSEDFVFYNKQGATNELDMTSSSSETTSVSSINSTSVSKHKPQKYSTKRVLKSSRRVSQTQLVKQPMSGGDSMRAGILAPVIYIMREKNDDEQVKLNFTLTVSLAGFSLSLVDHQANVNSILLTRIQSQTDINNIYEKHSLKLKRFDIIASRLGDKTNSSNKVILTSDANIFDPNMYLNHRFEKPSSTTIPPTFLDVTFTKALVSNFNKRVNLTASDATTAANSKRDRFFERLEARLSHHETEQKWISELNMNITHLDIMFTPASLSPLISQTLDIVSLFPAAEQTELIPFIRARDMPLLNIELERFRLMNPVQNHVIVLQLLGLNLTSQVENPIIRAFAQNARPNSSQTIYDRAKSTGLIYRPGFIFEDRQYLFEIKNTAVFLNEPTPLPIIDQLTIRAILALPILCDRHLINGYMLEISVGPNLDIHASDFNINVIRDAVRETTAVMKSFARPKSVSTPIRDKNTNKNVTTKLDLVPLDLLLTCESVNFYFSKREENHFRSLLTIQLIQPHISLIIHERSQRFEVSVFDFEVRGSKNSSDCVEKIVETKKDEKNPKTGITPGFFSFRINNFAKLICGVNPDDETKEKEELEMSQVVVCDECLKCYETSKTEPENSMNSQLNIDRPTRFKINFEYVQEIIKFFESLTNLTASRDDIKQPEEHQITSTYDQLAPLFALNLSISTSQLAFQFDFDSLANLSFNASLNRFTLLANKSKSIDFDCVSKATLCSDLVHLNVKLCDFVCKLDYLGDKTVVNGSTTSNLHVLGPITIKFFADYSVSDNELFAFFDFGSFNVSFNRYLYEYFMNVQNILTDYFSKKQNFTKKYSKIEPTEKKPLESICNEELFTTKSYTDDLRNGSLIYTILDELTSKTLKPNESSLYSMVLPRINEIKCVDDMNNISSSSSYICWRYAKRRALVSLKILPLPFVGGIQTAQAPKCFLEFYNECTKKFTVIHEFVIEEGLPVYIDLKSLVAFSKIWRVQLSKEAQKLIFASSLVASTRVDSVEQIMVTPHQQHFWSHVEFGLSGLELKINSIGSNLSNSDLLMLTLGQFSSRAILDRVRDEKRGLWRRAFSVHSLGQCQIDYCEYRFITSRPLLESAQFKASVEYSSSRNELNVRAEFDTLNFLMSQSTLICLRQLENEWLAENKEKWSPPMQFYMLYNDTSMILNVKQQNTEETCPIHPGTSLAYSWRSHKKHQLLQLYLPKYKLTSKPFQINRNGLDEIRLVDPTRNINISIIVRIETRLDQSNLSLPYFNRSKESLSFKKFVSFQARLCVVNMVNLEISNVGLIYSDESAVEVQFGPIPKYSRSTYTHEIVESSSSSPLIDITSIRVNEDSIVASSKKQQDFLNKLINGLCVYDARQSVKYWLNLYENKLDGESTVSQICVVLTPVLVLCSYLPYELDIRLNGEEKICRIKSNAISYCSSTDFDVAKIGIWFDRLSRSSCSEEENDDINEKFLEYTNRNPIWFETDKVRLENGAFNIALCQSFTDKRLVFVDYFTYTWYNTEPAMTEHIDRNSLKSLEISANNNIARSSSAGQAKNEQLSSSESIGSSSSIAAEKPSNTVNINSWISGELQIGKSLCWSFSKTIRVDIRPLCLCVNRTEHSILLIEKTPKQELDFDIEPNLGQICLSNLSNEGNNNGKKYKLRITRDEYHTNSRELNLIKHEISYESDWFEIKEEQGSPFYREQTSLSGGNGALCLYATNKCWIDLKLYPNMKSARLKCIYLTMSSEIVKHSVTARRRKQKANNGGGSNAAGVGSDPNVIESEEGVVSEPGDVWTRVLSIQSKFVVKNKTAYDFRAKIVNSHHSIGENRVHRFLDTEARRFVKRNEYQTNDMILNLDNFYLKEAEQINSNSEYDPLKAEYEHEKDKLEDLFYFRIQELSSFSSQPIQSRPLLLTIREKALRQLGAQSQSDESHLVSRQCFCCYLSTNNTEQTTLSFVLAQKLMVNHLGQLLITIDTSSHNLVELHNRSKRDLLIWPRVTTNYILETYVKNVSQLNERRLSHQRKFRPLIEKNKRVIDLSRSLTYMHLVPANTTFKFNYDFVGTNQFPIENLNEQVFFMFAVSNSSDGALNLSQNLCKIYENQFEIRFENLAEKLYYVADQSESNQLIQTRIISESLQSESTSVTRKLGQTKVKTSVNIERLTFALNDDHLSQLYQTEILRVTLDETNLGVSIVDGIEIDFSCSHFQLDNQMFDLDSVEDNEFNKVAQKYDFPVIFIPRQRNRRQITNSRNYYQLLDFFTQSEPNLASNFIKTHVKLQSTDPKSSLMRLTHLDLDIKPFDAYLEDYLIYNLAEIGLEFFELASSPTSNRRYTKEIKRYQMHEMDLDLVSRPLLTANYMRISRIDALVSLQTSLKIYLASYKMPIVFDELVIRGMPLAVLSSPQLVKNLTAHYLTALLFRAGWLLGSLELIGSPTAFVQQVSNGVFDFIRMPYQGMRESGASGLIHGFSNGFLSLVQNLSAGTITSLTSFASFVSRNMDILSFDPSHLARQERLRHQQSTSILEVSSSFLITIMGAIGGLANQPIVSIQESDSIIKGVSKGIIGLVTKPVGAVAELVNQTGQGLLRITGVNRLPPNEHRLERRAFNRRFSLFTMSSTKLHAKLLHPNQQQQQSWTQIHAMLEAVYSLSSSGNSKSDAANLSGCYLALSDEALFVVDKQEDMLMRAFYVSEIEITRSDDDPTLLVITLLNRHAVATRKRNSVNEDNDPLLIDRLVNYVLQTTSRGQQRPDSEPDELFLRNSAFLVSTFRQYASSNLNGYLKQYGGLPCCRRAQTTAKSQQQRPSLTTQTINEVIARSIQTRRRAASSADVSNIDSPMIHLSRPDNEPDNSSLSSLSTSNEAKQFFYYVDPRLLDNFISIFNSLKRKSLNKDFQF